MQQNKFSISGLRIAGIITLLVLLICVRVFETKLFYDPLLAFFKHESKILPQYNSLKLFLGLFFRYVLNSTISVGILWLAFKDVQVIKLSAVLFAGLFVLLTAMLFIVLSFEHPNLLSVFYIRRFLIQPFLLILFLPAFYYQKYLK
ncbi:MAG: exosortase F system-associated protein [Bacteroidota bacterium]